MYETFLSNLVAIACGLCLACSSTNAAAQNQSSTSAEPTPSVNTNGQPAVASVSESPSESTSESTLTSEGVIPSAASDQRNLRATILIGSFTVFLLAVFVGFEIITKVPPTLHTPLMSGSNAISGITVVGAILTAGHAAGGLGSLLGMLAVILATINVVGGFLVTHRMLMMFKKR